MPAKWYILIRRYFQCPETVPKSKLSNHPNRAPNKRTMYETASQMLKIKDLKADPFVERKNMVHENQ